MRSFWSCLGYRIRHVGHILHAKFGGLVKASYRAPLNRAP